MKRCSGTANRQLRGKKIAPNLAHEKKRYNKSGSSISLKQNIMKKVEAEFAFKLLNDIQPRPNEYSKDEVIESLDSVVLAI